jgi:hypothetical protein
VLVTLHEQFTVSIEQQNYRICITNTEGSFSVLPTTLLHNGWYFCFLMNSPGVAAVVHVIDRMETVSATVWIQN